MILTENSKPAANGQQLPSSYHYEQSVLSCILWEGESDRAAASEKLSQLDQKYFYDLNNKRTFEALQRCEAKGDSLDTTSTIRNSKGVEISYITQLPDVVPSPSVFSDKLKCLKDAFTKRKLKHVLDIANRLSSDDNMPADGILCDLEEQISNIQQQSDGAIAAFPQIVNASDLLEMDVETPPELVSGILHQGCKMVLSGGSKSHKTWTLLDLAISVSSGAAFLGFQAAQTDVLYVNLELPTFSIRKRLKDILRFKDGCNSDRLDILNLKGHATDISSLRLRMQPQLRRKSYGLIIFDPIYKVYGDRDENSVSGVAEIMNQLDVIVAETGAAVVFAAHQTKGNQAGRESIDRIAGSGAFARDADSILIFTAHDKSDCFTVSSILRNFRPTPEFVVQWEHPLMIRDGNLDPEHLKLRRQSNPVRHNTVEELLAHVPPDGSPIAKNVLKTTANKAGIGVNKISPLIDQLKDEGRLHEWEEPRKNSRPKLIISRKPKPSEDLPMMHTI